LLDKYKGVITEKSEEIAGETFQRGGRSARISYMDVSAHPDLDMPSR
jgi:hypothetical protein